MTYSPRAGKKPCSRPERTGLPRMIDSTNIVSFLRVVTRGLLTFLFPEIATKYQPVDHYMRGPGPKLKAKHFDDQGTTGGV